MAVITVLNQKGGVGKTGACHHLAGTLALMGRRVLLVDNDPQSSLTQGLWGPPKALSIDPAETIALARLYHYKARNQLPPLKNSRRDPPRQ